MKYHQCRDRAFFLTASILLAGADWTASILLANAGSSGVMEFSRERGSLACGPGSSGVLATSNNQVD